MYDILSITNRSLCRGDFCEQIEKIAAAHPAGIVLREKDLAEADYILLAKRVMEICRKYQVPCILHSFVKAAISLQAEAIHLPLPLLRQLTEEQKTHFTVIGASCHSAADAEEAEKLGCTYITAGHVFDTDCKKGLPGRGLDFLQSVCESVKIPVYAIGGISAERMPAVKKAGAAGACIMSGLMKCDDPASYLAEFSDRP